ncbi:hypothetical protein H9P43_007739 [Blastocladiella emersonii ATCC 22665]|nr:hypothetical protein H9P43_007739 [Blastocladiella emersonii ATCC 22665]
MHSTKSILLALLALVATAAANPGGAPACAVNEQKITAGMGPPQGDLKFKLEASTTEYEPGKPIMMKVVSENPATKTHKGLLLYVEPANDAKKRVGTFKIPEGFKSNTDKCGALQVAAETDSVITHASPADKPLGAELMWTAPAAGMGDLTVRAVVAGTGGKNWQILQTVTLKQKGGSAAAPGGGYAGGGAAGGKRKVCKRWRKKGTGGGASAAPAPSAPAADQPPMASSTSMAMSSSSSAAASATESASASTTASAAPAAPTETPAPAPAPGGEGAPAAPPAEGGAAPAPPAEGGAAPAPPAEGAQAAPPAEGAQAAPVEGAQGAASTDPQASSGSRSGPSAAAAVVVAAVVAMVF